MARNKVGKGVTLVAEGTEVRGDIHFRDQLVVNGLVTGNLFASSDAEATVMISDEGAVHGEIHVPNVVINGQIEGDVYASARVELAAKARVKGNVYYKLIEMQLGAMVDGQLVHDEQVGAENVHLLRAENGSGAVAERD